MTSLDFRDYAAKPLPQMAGARSRLHFKPWLKRLVCDTLLLPYAMVKHKALLRTGVRVDNHTYTCFLRAPSQLKLLCGPVLDHIGRGERLDITLLACSNGAEPYTIASWLLQNVPDLDFRICASDLHPAMVERARSAIYSADEALHSEYMTEDFFNATFLPHNDGFVVRPEVRKMVDFSQASLLDGEGLQSQFGEARLVIAQNVLFHLSPEDATQAFANIVKLTAPGGAIMVEGMDLGLREKLAREHGLEPFAEYLREIHKETRAHTPIRWWNYYWGTEPFIGFRPDALRRYATVYRRADG